MFWAHQYNKKLIHLRPKDERKKPSKLDLYKTQILKDFVKRIGALQVQVQLYLII